MNRYIVFIQSPIHLRNWSEIAPENVGALIVCESRLKLDVCSPKLLEKYPVRRIEPSEVESLFGPDICGVLFFAMHPRPIPLRLIDQAQRRSLPVIAAQESNQISLNAGRVNNYLLPADYIFSASPKELEWMVRHGVNRDVIESLGWAFHYGAETPPPDAVRNEMKQKLGLSEEGKVAAFLPIGFAAPGESMKNRGRQLSMCRGLCRHGWQVIAKPHPAEPLDFFANIARKYAPEIKVIDSRVDVEDLLIASDVVLGRGVSQTVLQAYLIGRPVVKLDLGDRTPIDVIDRDFQVTHARHIRRACEKAVSSAAYESSARLVMEQHLPVLPSVARKALKIRLSTPPLWRPERAIGGREKLQQLAAWKDDELYQQMCGGNSAAWEQTDSGEWGDFYLQVSRALRLRKNPDTVLLEKMAATFPGETHVSMFVDDLLLLARVLQERNLWKLLDRMEKRLQLHFADEFGMDKVLTAIRNSKPRARLLSWTNKIIKKGKL